MFPQTDVRTEKAPRLSRKTKKVSSAHFKSVFIPYFLIFPEAGSRMDLTLLKNLTGLHLFQGMWGCQLYLCHSSATRTSPSLPRQETTQLPQHCLSAANTEVNEAREESCSGDDIQEKKKYLHMYLHHKFVLCFILFFPDKNEPHEELCPSVSANLGREWRMDWDTEV